MRSAWPPPIDLASRRHASTASSSGSTRTSTASATARPAEPTWPAWPTSQPRPTTLDRFLTELTLDPPASTSDLAGPPHLDDDVLTLSTIHSAKGGEWDIVHLLHAADGNIPSDMATGDPEQIEEERRLLYVAATRARDQLHIHVPLRFHHHRGRFDDAHSLGQRSRFLTPEVVDAMDETRPAAPGQVDGQAWTSELVVGDAVATADADLAALLGA